jgi:hypothetical protein
LAIRQHRCRATDRAKAASADLDGRRHDELAGNAIGMAKLDRGKEDADVGRLRLRQNGIRPRIVKQKLFDVLHPDGPVHAPLR